MYHSKESHSWYFPHRHHLEAAKIWWIFCADLTPCLINNWWLGGVGFRWYGSISVVPLPMGLQTWPNCFLVASSQIAQWIGRQWHLLFVWPHNKMSDLSPNCFCLLSNGDLKISTGSNLSRSTFSSILTRCMEDITKAGNDSSLVKCLLMPRAVESHFVSDVLRDGSAPDWLPEPTAWSW